MSKSLGNSPDLLQLIDKYGADAVRFGIMISAPAGNDLLFDEAGLEQGRNFNNKLWNALKLVNMWSVETAPARKDSLEPIREILPMTWFENRLNQAKTEIEKIFDGIQTQRSIKNHLFPDLG